MPAAIYLAWFDKDPKRSVKDKLNDARNAYVDRYRVEPNVARVNTAVADKVPPPWKVESTPTVPVNEFWVGVDVGAAA